MSMIEEVTGNWLCWVILLLALFCYQQLWLDYFSSPNHLKNQKNNNSTQNNNRLKREFSGILIGALPLLGLLGTIIGLLDCFAHIANEGVNGDLISGGIASALLTTQLGLICAIPGWLLLAWVVKVSDKPCVATALQTPSPRTTR